ncbi:hypothetical protein Tco_0590155 [Tanacetum coccineum]
MKALIEDENAIDKGVADTVQDHKRKHDDDDRDPIVGPNQCKAPSRGSKTGKSATAKEPVEEPIAKTAKSPNPEWFTQPPRPPTPDPKWNKRQYVLNRLKIDNLTQDIQLRPAHNLLKGTCSSSIKLKYHFQEYFNALTDRLDWNNPEGDHYL